MLAVYSNVSDYSVGAVQYYIGTQNGLWAEWNHCGEISDDALDYAGIERTVSAESQVEYETAQNLWTEFTGWITNLWNSLWE